MGRPLIGLTTYAEQQRLSGRDLQAVCLPVGYVRAINAVGGQPVLLPSEGIDEGVLDRLDGIVLCGGSDVGPNHYGEEPHPSVVITRPLRDEAELLLLRGALARDVPLLGVCRGLQLMAVAYGGRLHQHLPDALGHDGHRPAGEPRYGFHQVRLAPGSLGCKVLGDEVAVNSYHHQGIADPGRLTPTGWSAADDLIEVAEDPDKAFALGVQWHPEESTDLSVFSALIAAAAEHAARRVRRPLSTPPAEHAAREHAARRAG